MKNFVNISMHVILCPDSASLLYNAYPLSRPTELVYT